MRIQGFGSLKPVCGSSRDEIFLQWSSKISVHFQRLTSSNPKSLTRKESRYHRVRRMPLLLILELLVSRKCSEERVVTRLARLRERSSSSLEDPEIPRPVAQLATMPAMCDVILDRVQTTNKQPLYCFSSDHCIVLY